MVSRTATGTRRTRLTGLPTASPRDARGDSPGHDLWGDEETGPRLREGLLAAVAAAPGPGAVVANQTQGDLLRALATFCVRFDGASPDERRACRRALAIAQMGRLPDAREALASAALAHPGSPHVAVLRRLVNLLIDTRAPGSSGLGQMLRASRQAG